MNKAIFVFVLALPLTILTGCGGSGGSNDNATNEPATPTPPTTSTPDPVVYAGQFIDAAVEGLTYRTDSSTGVTDADGEFMYQASESVTFNVGSLELGSVAGRDIVTPMELFATTDMEDVRVVNMLRLLQSLDVDGDPQNGIKFGDGAINYANTLNLTFDEADFDSQVADLLMANQGVYLDLISAEQALLHFQTTLDELDLTAMSNCGDDHPKVGYSGDFETFFHDVSGRATIVDNCTIQVEFFNYDGEGPDVFFYAGTDHDYTSVDAFAIGEQLNGKVYNNASITLKLPRNRTLDDFNTLSVWCVDFAADFGHLVFTE
ncbi:DM13 domain-containing protein [Thalassotalea litorea]|uniref:DM13 domain-containing protein n=1 Tax=Thalassotalea litorea TaxID=2020715 RepID=A0A5R9IPZ3_9GAMM|nr:DM13 domain-containing protein [Thalassotalea litorea]TLU65286.1 DM13 domain-containing protein [Thalassotalea litorea]